MSKAEMKSKHHAMQCWPGNAAAAARACLVSGPFPAPPSTVSVTRDRSARVTCHEQHVAQEMVSLPADPLR